MIPHLRLLTGAQMARIDAETIQAGTPGHLLMARAGAGAAAVLRETLGGFAGRRIAVLCGKGNNGGDGFVVARLAQRFGAHVQCCLFAPPDQVRGDAAVHLAGAGRAGVEIEVHEQLPAGWVETLDSSDAVVDGLLGTGLKGPPRGVLGEAIDSLHRTRASIFAIDVPSGMDAATGGGNPPACAATIAFGPPKLGHFLFPGRAACGRLHLVDIGLSPSAIEALPPVFLNHAAGGTLPERDPRAHKGDAGRVAIVAGAAGTTGAAALSARAALKVGAGLVTVGTPTSVVDLIESHVVESMTRGLPEVRGHRCLARRARGEIDRLIRDVDVAAIGPGLGTHHETIDVVQRALSTAKVPTVVDADALNAFERCPERLLSGHPRILTPHPGEFRRLMGRRVENPLVDARDLADQAGATVLLKGAPSVVATSDGLMYINPSGNAGMATAGSGDVLTGILAGFLGQGLDSDEAACLGAFIHGLAGDIAAERTGRLGLTAGDLIDALPDAEAEVTEGRKRYLRTIRPPANFIEALN